MSYLTDQEAALRLDSVADQIAQLNKHVGDITGTLADLANDRLIKGYAELAAALDVKIETAKKIIERGEIDCLHYGGNIYFRRGDVWRYRPSGKAKGQAWAVTLDKDGLTFRRGDVVAEWSTTENRVRIRKGPRELDVKGCKAYKSPEAFVSELNKY